MFHHMAESSIIRTIASNIASLRASSPAVFSKQDFSHVIWAGVFGSYARETQTKSSDVDVVVIQKPRDKNCYIPPDTLHLGDALPEVWGRKVDIIYIMRNELRCYVSLEALLCSRTPYGSDQDEEVMRVRGIVRDMLDSGFVKFTDIVDKIRKTKSMVLDLDFQVCNHYTILVMRYFSIYY